MATWAWFAIAAGAGALIGLEVWAWLRHGVSAVGMTIVGVVELIPVLIAVCAVGGIALGMISGVTGWDPAGFNEDSNGAAVQDGGSCDPSYPDACLDPDALDYDCEGGSGDGPGYVSGPVVVSGDDPYDLDRDGDGIGCD